MAELSPSLRPELEIPDPIEAAQILARRLQDYQSRAASMLNEQAAQISLVHQRFLESRQQSLSDLAHLLHTDLAQRLHLPPSFLDRIGVKPAVFDHNKLVEFATGDIEACFGPAYAVYRGRRSPRIPNGKLMMMTRVTAIDGKPGDLTSGSIEVEFDCSADGWFIDHRLKNKIPNAVIMEIALQPCGFLSAYLETPMVAPHEDLYFRNLDGQALLHKSEPLSGQTITTRARLIETTLGAGMILQKFAFECSTNGNPFYEGEASFGYFPAAALETQNGLDGPTSKAPWRNQSTLKSLDSSAIVAAGHVNANLDTGYSVMEVDPIGGTNQLGYIYARKPVTPGDWFYKAHFYQDPVMPGSLGVEALYTIFKTLVVEKFPVLSSQPSALSLDALQPLVWKYRGQVRPHNQDMEFEVHIRQQELSSQSARFIADGSAWVDGKRIYDIKNLSLNFQIS